MDGRLVDHTPMEGFQKDSDTDSCENDVSPHWKSRGAGNPGYNPNDLLRNQRNYGINDQILGESSPQNAGPVFQRPKEGSGAVNDQRFVKRSFKAPGREPHQEGGSSNLAGFAYSDDLQPGTTIPPKPVVGNGTSMGKRNIKSLRADAERRASGMLESQGMIQANPNASNLGTLGALPPAGGGTIPGAAGIRNDAVRSLYEEEPSGGGPVVLAQQSGGPQFSTAPGAVITSPHDILNQAHPPAGVAASWAPPQPPPRPQMAMGSAVGMVPGAAGAAGAAAPGGSTIVEADMRVVSESSSEDEEEREAAMNEISRLQHLQQHGGDQSGMVGVMDGGHEPRVDPVAEDGLLVDEDGHPVAMGAGGSPLEPRRVMTQNGVVIINQDTQDALPDDYTMRSAQPAPNVLVVKNGKRIPCLHAARPIHLPPERFGTSVHLRKDFVMQPFPYADRSHTLQARVVRVREGLSGKFFPTYHLCVRNGPGADETILLAAQKQTGKVSLSSYYLITLDPRCFQKGASTYVAKLRANWAGTEYTLFSDGDNPKKTKRLRGSEQSLFDPSAAIREEMLAIKFSKPGNAPRRMVCIIPGPLPGNAYERQMFRSKPYSNLINYANGKETATEGEGINFLKFTNKIPVWDPRRQTFTINFYGRVRLPSSKNFQLVESEGEDAPPVVQFGRWYDDVFHLDGMWPFSVVQMFALALSTFDTRLQETFKMTY